MFCLIVSFVARGPILRSIIDERLLYFLLPEHDDLFLFMYICFIYLFIYLFQFFNQHQPNGKKIITN